MTRWERGLFRPHDVWLRRIVAMTNEHEAAAQAAAQATTTPEEVTIVP